VKPECEKALQDLERFLDGEIDQPQRGLLDAHLVGCTPCMERADFKRHVKELIASRCGCDEVPAGLQDRVSALLEGPTAPIPPIS
jgi:mycothiol system anti-sigma-R factor